MKLKSLQQACTEAYIKVVQQGRASVASVEGFRKCMYRGPNGDKCALGHLIADDFYSPELEGLAVGESRVSAALINSGVDVEKLFLATRVLSELQGAHDRASGVPPELFVHEFRRHAERIFTNNGWDIPVVPGVDTPIPVEEPQDDPQTPEEFIRSLGFAEYVAGVPAVAYG